MPYISQDRRDAIDYVELRYAGETCENPGELNYALTVLCREYLTSGGSCKYGYVGLNEVIGVLECAKQEFYRRLTVPYEDAKLEIHGDVYPSL